MNKLLLDIFRKFFYFKQKSVNLNCDLLLETVKYYLGINEKNLLIKDNGFI